jgi:hypothetical protein
MIALMNVALRFQRLYLLAGPFFRRRPPIESRREPGLASYIENRITEALIAFMTPRPRNLFAAV